MDMIIVILAAGLSRRFGSANKLLYEIDGESLIHHVAREACSAYETRVVVGHQENLIKGALSDLPVSFVYNPDYEKGQFTSAQAGIKGIDKPFFIMLGDLVKIRRESYLELSGLLEGHDAVRPFYRGVPGHPVLLAAHMAKVLLQCPANYSVRKALEGRDVHCHEGLDDSWIADMDTRP